MTAMWGKRWIATCGLVATALLASQAGAQEAPADGTPAAPIETTPPATAPLRVTAHPPRPGRAWVATLSGAAVARIGPSGSARVRMRVGALTPFGRTTTRLLVTRSVVREGRIWVEVMLPMRPNGTRGWIPQDHVRLHTTAHRVEVRLRARQLRVYRGGRVVLRVPVVVGASGTPTPVGRFAVAETVHTNIPGAFLGPIVLPLTGFSRTLNEFAGGDGRVAIHGTTLPGLMGTAASHGCVRLRNGDIRRLAALATAGTPVSIVR